MNAAAACQFCAPYPIDLSFFTKEASSWLKDCDLAVTDANGNVLFKVESHSWSLRNRHVLVDGTGKPLISLQHKMRSIHDRWQAFAGDSSDTKDLLFSVKRSSLRQPKTNLDVFLAANTKEEACDFKITGSYHKRSCTVYRGDSSTVVAKMSREYRSVNGPYSKDAFGVSVIANMDFSFVAAMVVLLHELHSEEDNDEKEHKKGKKEKKGKKQKNKKKWKKGKESKEKEEGEKEEEEEEEEEEESEEESEMDEEEVEEITTGVFGLISEIVSAISEA